MSPIVLMLLVFVQAALFKCMQLSARKLEERGVSALAILSLQRWAIFPAIILFLGVYDQAYVDTILANRELTLSIILIAILWTAGQYMTYVWINAASSVSFLYVLNAFFNLPALVATGIILNGDIPNGYAIAALILLASALLIRPTQHRTNSRALLKYSILITALIVCLDILTHAITGGLYRNLLQDLDGGIQFGLALYVLTATFMLNILYLIFRKPSKSEKSVIAAHPWTAALIPICWFTASLPEGFAYANIPIFTLVALSSVSFLMNLGSDLRNKRISLDSHTLLFIILVLGSIAFSTLSL